MEFYKPSAYHDENSRRSEGIVYCSILHFEDNCRLRGLECHSALSDPLGRSIKTRERDDVIKRVHVINTRFYASSSAL